MSDRRPNDDDSMRKGHALPPDGRAEVVAVVTLAGRPDFRLGAATVRPSLISVEGPGGKISTEPRVMQVLVALADADGKVLSRDELLRRCWSGAVVSDDAINRTIVEIRRIARKTQGGFQIETVPRVGYRLTRDNPPEPARTPESPGKPRVNRRWVLGWIATATGVGAFIVWKASFQPSATRYAQLVEQGRRDLRYGSPDADQRAIKAFSEATRLRPDDALPWGMLAYAQLRSSESLPPPEANAAFRASEQFARRAVSINAREPNALVALAHMQKALDDWYTTEKKLREVLAVDPANENALSHLVGLLQAGGFVKESWDLNESVIRIDALQPPVQMRRALKLWIMGKAAEADRVSARARELWPTHQLVANARLLILAFTGRWQATHDFIGQTGPNAILPPAGVSMWRTGLRALETRSPADIATAREVILTEARSSPGLSVHGIMIAGALGDSDTAFHLIDGLLLSRGASTRPGSKDDPTLMIDPGWRETQWLFTPATAALRADARFDALAEDIGLAEYWRRRGKLPDERQPVA